MHPLLNVTLQVIYVIMRYMTGLRKIYNFYSCLGYEESPDNTFVMNKMQMWRFLKDCRLHHLGSTLADMDRVLAQAEGHSGRVQVFLVVQSAPTPPCP